MDYKEKLDLERKDFFKKLKDFRKKQKEYKNKARHEFEQLLNDDEDFKIQWGFKDTYKEIDFLEWFKDVYIKEGGLK